MKEVFVLERHGLIIVHTGDGKGKTTAALGLALRAFGAGLRVLVLQFTKGKKKSGELNALDVLKNFSPTIEVKIFATKIWGGFCFGKTRIDNRPHRRRKR